MSKIVLDAISKSLSELERVVPQPSGDLGYGSDLSCTSDVTEDLAEVDPFSPRGIAEAVLRRLTTARGTLRDDADFGIDLRSYCNRGVTAQDLRDLGGLASAEISKDDRIDEASTVTVTAAGTSLTVEVWIVPANPTVDPFSLTLAVTSGAALLEAINHAAV